jgi:integrase
LKKIRPRDLRHSFGTIWAERIPPTVLKEMMGHSSILTTERYIHTTDEILRRSLEQVLGNEPKKNGKTR